MSTTTTISHGPGRVALPPADLTQLEQIRSCVHRQCFACQHEAFRLEFELESDQILVARTRLGPHYSSYSNTTHGGILALLMDEMSACCLFAHGIEAVTVELKVRFRRAVRPAEPFTLRARAEMVRAPRYRVQVWLEQKGRKAVSGVAEMWRREVSGPADATDDAS